MLVNVGMGLVSGDTDYGLNIRLLLYISQTMNTLPEDIQDTIYKYMHQLEFKNVINEIRTFRRNRMRAFPLLCYKCYRDKELCEECLYNFEIKMEWLNDPPNWVSISDCESDSDISIPSDFSLTMY